MNYADNSFVVYFHSFMWAAKNTGKCNKAINEIVHMLEKRKKLLA